MKKKQSKKKARSRSPQFEYGMAAWEERKKDVKAFVGV